MWESWGVWIHRLSLTARQISGWGERNILKDCLQRRITLHTPMIMRMKMMIKYALLAPGNFCKSKWERST